MNTQQRDENLKQIAKLILTASDTLLEAARLTTPILREILQNQKEEPTPCQKS